MGPLLAALAPGIPGLIGSIFGGFGAKSQAEAERRNVQEQQERTIAANKQLAEYQYSKDLEMWNLGNAYNSPEQQMRRLEGAGLNPNLVYGSGAVGNMAASLPKYQAPTVEYSAPVGQDIPGMIAQFQDVQIKQAQLDNLRAQRKVIGEEAITKEMLNKVQGAPGVKEAMSGQVIERANLTGYQWRKANMEFEKLRSQSGYFDEMAKSQLDYAQGRVYQQSAAVNKILQETELSKLKTDYFVADAISSIAGRVLGPALKMFGVGAKSAGKAVAPLNQKIPLSRRQGPYWSGYKNYKRRNP